MSSQKSWSDVHRLANEQGEPGYFDPDTGLFVMTEGFLVRRGYCCDNGCRHCPYGQDADG